MTSSFCASSNVTRRVLSPPARMYDEEIERDGVGIVARRHAEAEHQLMLLHRHGDRGADERALRRLGRALADGQGGAFPVGEGLGHLLAHERRAHVADDHQHDVVRHVPAVEERRAPSCDRAPRSSSSSR